MTQKLFSIFLIVSLLLPVTTVQADSLWNQNQGSVYGTAKRQVLPGDTITILVQETTSATQEASTRTAKESQVMVDFLEGFNRISDSLGNLQNESESKYDISGEDSYNGSGATSRRSRVTAIVTAEVTQVLESGNLFVIGEKKVKVNNEMQTIKVSGIIRPSDIAPNNTVRSSQMAKVEVSINGSGVVGDKQSPGMLTKMFNWLY